VGPRFGASTRVGEHATPPRAAATCRSRLRLPIDMGASVVPDRNGVDLTAACSQAAADVRHGSRTMELSASAAVIGIHEP
jgi:hypothetical protein